MGKKSPFKDKRKDYTSPVFKNGTPANRETSGAAGGSPQEEPRQQQAQSVTGGGPAPIARDELQRLRNLEQELQERLTQTRALEEQLAASAAGLEAERTSVAAERLRAAEVTAAVSHAEEEARVARAEAEAAATRLQAQGLLLERSVRAQVAGEFADMLREAEEALAAERCNQAAALQSARSGWELERAELEAELAAVRERIAELEGQLHALRAKSQQREEALERRLARVTDREAELDERETWLESRRAELDPAAVTRLQWQLDLAQGRIAGMEAEMTRLARENDELKERWTRLDGSDPAVLQALLDEERARLRQALDRVAQLEPRVTADTELRVRADQADTLHTRVRTLTEENARLQSEVVHGEDTKQQLEIAKRQALTYWTRWQEVERELKLDLEARQKKMASRFADFYSLQANPELQEAVTVDAGWDLKTIVSEAQWGLKQNGFRYPAAVLRAFIASLRTSRLVILEGLSGTGKTSLPSELAKYFKFGYKIVPVQPRWRDSSDLFGWLNAMDQQFTASEFSKALFEASLPRYANQPYFIILDEMNLAHVEYYFAEIHSSRFIEFEESHHDVRLVSARDVSGDESDILPGGYLRVPENVWFIGTVNADHTVKEISDRVYDRAQVLQFADWAEEPVSRPASPAARPALASLLREFGPSPAPVQVYVKAVQTAMKEHLFTNFGPRVSRSFERFAPACIAAGGELREAVDWQLCAKVLPKMRLLGHRLTAERVDSFLKAIRPHWANLPGTLSEPREFLSQVYGLEVAAE